jgi:HEAT repeat protein
VNKPGEKHAATRSSAETRKLAKIKGADSVHELITFLGDPSSLVRAAAADKLGKIDYRSTQMNGAEHEQDLSEVEPLVNALKDSHALVRAASAESLGEIGDVRAVDPLIALLRDAKPQVVVVAANALSEMVTSQDYAGDALSRANHEAAGKALVGLLSSNDESVRQAAISALVNVGTLDDMKQVVSLLQDKDIIVRSQAASALARAFYPNPNSKRASELDALEQAAGPTLAAAVSDKQTRYAALSALHAMKSPPAAAAHPIAEILKYNVWIHVDGIQRPEIQGGAFDGFQGPNEIGDAIDVLARTGGAESVPMLLKFVTTSNPEAAKHATTGLAKLGDPRAISPLLEVLQSKGYGIQPDAAAALGAFQDPRIVPALILSLQSDNFAQRAASASALSHFHDPRVAPALIHSLTDENADVRLKAAEALGNLGNPAAVGPLGQIAKTNYEAVRALGKLRFPGSLAALVSVMEDQRVQFRSEAVTALAKLGDPQAVPALIQTMEQELALDGSSTLAVQCVYSLGIIKDPRAVEPLRKLLGKPTMASQEAEQALKEMGIPLAAPK